MTFAIEKYNKLFKKIPVGTLSRSASDKEKNVMSHAEYRLLKDGELYVSELLDGNLISKTIGKYTLFFRNLNVARHLQYRRLDGFLVFEAAVKDNILINPTTEDYRTLANFFRVQFMDHVLNPTITYMHEILGYRSRFDSSIAPYGYKFWNFKYQRFGYILTYEVLVGKDISLKKHGKVIYNKMRPD